MFPTEKTGYCRVCGEKTALSKEHIIPKKAGGNRRVKLYTAREVFQNKGNMSKVHGRIVQTGLCGRTLCEKCNNHSGHYYDDAFSNFLNAINYNVDVLLRKSRVSCSMPDCSGITIENRRPHKIKPMNIAKRVLVTFCSNEQWPISKNFPEIRNTIIEHTYKPCTEGFRIFFSALFRGNNGFFSDISMLHTELGILTFSGFEYCHTGFYFTDKNCNMPRDMLDITSWLTEYNYDQEVDFYFTLPLTYTHGLPTPIIQES